MAEGGLPGEAVSPDEGISLDEGISVAAAHMLLDLLASTHLTRPDDVAGVLAEQARVMRRSVEEARSQPTSSLLFASTGG